MSVSVDKVRSMLKFGMVGAVCLTLTACAAQYRYHGYIPTEEDLSAIQVGVDTRDTVAESIGTPGSSGVLRDSGYYYVSTQIRHYGATAPKVVSRELVAISFTEAGVVQNIERFGLEDGRVIPLQRRVTSSGVQDNTFLRQLLGNVGNFNPTQALQ